MGLHNNSARVVGRTIMMEKIPNEVMGRDFLIISNNALDYDLDSKVNMRRKMRILLMLSILMMGLLWSKSPKINTDQPAPDFVLLDQDSSLRKLSDYRGNWVVVYFYPKDDTPGCTKEACGIRDDYTKFAQQKIVVLGISYDSPRSHRAFIKKYNLPFTLLSDGDKSVSELYAAKGLLFADRKTFLIDPEGIIRKIYNKVDVTSHSIEILADITRLSATE